MPEPDFVLRQGDTASVIRATLTDADDNPVDLNAADVEFHMRPIGGTALTVDATATIDSPSGGSVSYQWGTADTTTPGLYVAEWEVIYAGGDQQTFPNAGYTLVMITEQLA